MVTSVRSAPVRANSQWIERLFFLVSALAVFTLAHGETLYKSVTPDGRVIYSDHPTQQAKVVETLTAASGPSTTLSASLRAQLGRIKSTAGQGDATDGVVLYTEQGCPYCRQAKAYLSARQIAYREVDIGSSSGLAAFARAGGRDGVPLLIAGERSVQGFSKESYDAVFPDSQ